MGCNEGLSKEIQEATKLQTLDIISIYIYIYIYIYLCISLYIYISI